MSTIVDLHSTLKTENQLQKETEEHGTKNELNLYFLVHLITISIGEILAPNEHKFKL